MSMFAVFAAVLFLAYGAAAVIKPERVWYFFERLFSYEPEPDELKILLYRISGIAAVFAGVILIYAGLR